MQLQLMGVLTILVGTAIFMLPVGAAYIVLAISTVFGAAAAISLPVLGGASVLVPNFFLVFFILRCLKAFGPGPAVEAVHVGRVGFTLLVLTAFALLTAFTFPYLFKGEAETMIVQRTAGARSVLTFAPLRFTSNNVTQSVYALGGLLCFIFSFSYFSQTGNREQFIKAILIAGSVNIAFAILDIVTHFTGTDYLLGFVRTANYAMLTDFEKGGLKRISGAFPEASAFADYTLTIFSITATLWLRRIHSYSTGLIAALSLIFLILSTSATALVCLAIVLPVIFVQSVLTGIASPARSRPAALIVIAAGIPFVALLLIVMFPNVVATIGDFINEIVLSKANSQSGRERSAWNNVAFQTFVDTNWLGAGLGSARASSFVIVLLSNIGLPGFILFALFIVLLMAVKTETKSESADGLTTAAKNGVFAALVTAAISGTGYDLGLVFYILAGFIASQGNALRERLGVAADGRRLAYPPSFERESPGS